MYPFTLLAADYQCLGEPAILLDRVRRLFVLSPLIDADMDFTPVRFSWHSTGLASFSIDLRQGEDADLIVSAEGLVLVGFVKGVSATVPTPLERAASNGRSCQLLAIASTAVADWRRWTFCVWRTIAANSWHAAPQMLATKEARRDSLGMCSLLTASSEDLGDFVMHMTESKTLGNVARRYLEQPTPDVTRVVKLKSISPQAIGMIKERAWIMGFLP
jgi:hypothetical protein